MASDLTLVVCGKPAGLPPTPANYGSILTHLGEQIDYVLRELGWLGTQDATRISMLGPFLGRSLLELAFTAIIGRLDPFRLLVLYQAQSEPSYDAGAQYRLSIRWQGDVMAEAPAKLWSESTSYEKISRGLLCDYYASVLWRPAFERAITELNGSQQWLAGLKTLDSSNVIPRKRNELSAIYSALSKGIHHEFIMPPGALYDKATVGDLVQRALHEIADLALLTHFVPHSLCTLPAQECLDAYGRIEQMEMLT